MDSPLRKSSERSKQRLPKDSEEYKRLQIRKKRRGISFLRADENRHLTRFRILLPTRVTGWEIGPHHKRMLFTGD